MKRGEQIQLKNVKKIIKKEAKTVLCLPKREKLSLAQEANFMARH